MLAGHGHTVLCAPRGGVHAGHWNGGCSPGELQAASLDPATELRSAREEMRAENASELVQAHEEAAAAARELQKV